MHDGRGNPSIRFIHLIRDINVSAWGIRNAFHCAAMQKQGHHELRTGYYLKVINLLSAVCFMIL